MKKMLAIALAVMLVPFTAFGLEMLQDSAMDEVTGQAGVSINVDAVVSNLDIGVISWGDTDGVGNFFTTAYDGNYNVFGSAGAGYVGLTGLNVTNLRVQARQDYDRDIWAAALQVGGFIADASTATADEIEEATMTVRSQLVLMAADPTQDPEDHPLYDTYSNYSQGLVDNNQFITIDVATSDGTYGDSRYDAGTTFVRIGLGTWDVTMDSMTATVELGQSKDLVDDEILGDISMQGMQLLLAADSFVEIYADRNSQGVNIFMDVEVDSLTFDTMAWGDVGGLNTADTSTGWVGLSGFAITDLTMDGTLGIDVATGANGTYVAIGFDGLAVGMGTMRADVSLGATADLDTAQVLGSFYNGDMDVTIGSGAVNIYGRAEVTTDPYDPTNAYHESGVTLNFALANTTVSVLASSWGDADGVGADANAGYVGMTNMLITGLNVSGNLTIDVGTAALLRSDYYARLMEDNASFVRLGLTNLAVGFTAMDAICRLGNDEALGGAYEADSITPSLAGAGIQTLGSIYVGNMSATVNGFVDILAH